MNFKKRIASVLLLITMLVTLVSSTSKAEGNRPIPDDAVKIKTTAYMLDGITATGCKTRSGICAGADWMVDQANEEDGSWVAIVWTVDGEYLGLFEVLDKGGTTAIKKGNVIDVWFETYDECVEWMTKTQGKCIVQYVWAVG